MEIKSKTIIKSLCLYQKMFIREFYDYQRFDGQLKIQKTYFRDKNSFKNCYKEYLKNLVPALKKTLVKTSLEWQKPMKLGQNVQNRQQLQDKNK